MVNIFPKIKTIFDIQRLYEATIVEFGCTYLVVIPRKAISYAFVDVWQVSHGESCPFRAPIPERKRAIKIPFTPSTHLGIPVKQSHKLRMGKN